MESTLKKYAARIERGEVNPHVRHDGHSNGLIFDPSQEETPLSVLGFGVYHLSSREIVRETGDLEMVLVPQDGTFEAEVDGERFSGERAGGSLAPEPGKTNASALYVPRGSVLRIRGSGEIAFYQAPALGKKPASYFPQSAAQVVSRGEWVWRRDVVNLVSPRDASTRLIVGETLSPPGFWSSTPLHLHDKDDPAGKETDLEEVYYHRLGPATPAGSQFNAYGVQLLFDGKGLNKSWIVGDRSVFAIPGAAHPVVASPVCAHLYLWGLAGTGDRLIPRDIPEFVHLKAFEEVLRELRAGLKPVSVDSARFDALCVRHGLNDTQKSLLWKMLGDQDIQVR